MKVCICSANCKRLIGALLFFLLLACAEQERPQLPEPLPDPEQLARESSRPEPESTPAAIKRNVKLPILRVSEWSRAEDPRWNSLLLPGANST